MTAVEAVTGKQRSIGGDTVVVTLVKPVLHKMKVLLQVVATVVVVAVAVQQQPNLKAENENVAVVAVARAKNVLRRKARLVLPRPLPPLLLPPYQRMRMLLWLIMVMVHTLARTCFQNDRKQMNISLVL